MPDRQNQLRIHDSTRDKTSSSESLTEAEIAQAGEGAAGFTVEWMEGTGLTDRISPETQQFFAAFVRAAGEVAFKYGDDLPKRKDLLEEVAHRFAPQLAKDKRELARQVQTDKLTGLANRAALDRAEGSAEADDNTRFVFIDANNFGEVNKRLSHAVGDEALKGVAEHLRVIAREVLGTDGRIFRRGGDEFVVIVPRDKAKELRRTLLEKYGATTDTIDWEEEAHAELQPNYDATSDRGVYTMHNDEKVGHMTYGRGDKSVTVSLSVGVGDTIQEADEASQKFKKEFKAEFAMTNTRGLGKHALDSIIRRRKKH